MKLHELDCFKSEKKSRKRRGRGPSSGLGCTAGKGHKGQRARAGSGPALGFEGGQMPLNRRLPKYGFNNKKFRVEYNVVNLEQLETYFKYKNRIELEDLLTWIGSGKPVKVLGNGEINRVIEVTAHRFSKSARKKIEDAGGKVLALEDGK